MRPNPDQNARPPASSTGDQESGEYSGLPPMAVRIGEAARILSVSVSTVDRWRRDGILESTRIRGTRLFRVADLHRLLDMHTESGDGGAN